MKSIRRIIKAIIDFFKRNSEEIDAIVLKVVNAIADLLIDQLKNIVKT